MQFATGSSVSGNLGLDLLLWVACLPRCVKGVFPIRLSLYGTPFRFIHRITFESEFNVKFSWFLDSNSIIIRINFQTQDIKAQCSKYDSLSGTFQNIKNSFSGTLRIVALCI